MNTQIGLLILNNKLVLNIKDLTPDVIPNGWSTIGIDNFFDSDINTNYDITIDITIETKGATSNEIKTYTGSFTRDDFSMATAGNTLIATQEDIYYNLALINDVLTPIAYGSNDLTNFEQFPDGIYTITYSVDDDGTIYTSTSEFVLTDSAEQIIMQKSNALQNKIFTCPNWDIEETLDFLVYRTMYLSLTTATLQAQKQTILNTLDHINNENYEYYTD